MKNIMWFNEVSMQDIELVGGKNASLGEMINNLTNLGIRIPHGFATTASAYREFLEQQGLYHKIHKLLQNLNVDDVSKLSQIGKQIRQSILETPFLSTFESDLRQAYEKLCLQYPHPISVAVRSSATAEDLPDASFAGQQETILNVANFENLLQALKEVFASLFNDRAIAYRVHQGFDHKQVALSAGIQCMVRSDKGVSGVMFTVDTESGFEDVILITASYGLGETIVQGAVNPDEYYVYKPNLSKKIPAIIRRNLGSKALKMIYNTKGSSPTVITESVPQSMQQCFALTSKEITELAQQAMIIEKHYGRPMDIEWAKDGIDQQLYILQARPETVTSQQSAQIIDRYILKESGNLLVTGRSIGQKIGQGNAKIIHNISQMDQVKAGDVLVTDMTDPDWEPIMQRASAIVTNRGGRTCHAAIIAREMGIPAVVGCIDATEKITAGKPITVSCAEGDTGKVYEGLLQFQQQAISVSAMPKIPCQIMMNIANPDRALDFQKIPNAGVGLARLEFIINRLIGFHPQGLLAPHLLPSDIQQIIAQSTAAYANPKDFYIEKLTEGIATLAAAFYPKPIIVRLSDFKSNEYANLIGGKHFEPEEENPMLGFRGASRYISTSFQACFELECAALYQARFAMGFNNIKIMVPFVRNLQEAKLVIDLLAKNGLVRGKEGLEFIMMCELPTNALLAEQYLQYFDGFSIGSNDLTQLTLGLDRDSGLVASSFDERDEAVKVLLKLAIQACKKAGKYIGICGQGPSDHPDFAKWLINEGIDSISLNPDTVVATWLYLAEHQS